MLRKAKVFALGRLLLECFEGKAGRDLVVELPDVGNVQAPVVSFEPVLIACSLGILSIMGLNTGTQSERHAERKGGEKPFGNNPMQGAKTGLFYSRLYPSYKTADTPNWAENSIKRPSNAVGNGSLRALLPLRRR